MNSADRPKIAYVSPVPPEQSGIADYSMDILPALAGLMDVHVFSTGTSLSSGMEFPCTPAMDVTVDVLDRDYDAVIVQMANDPRMALALEFVRCNRSVLMLHDLNISTIFGELYLSRGEVMEFFWQMVTHEGVFGALGAASKFLLTRECPEMFDYDMIRGVCEQSSVVMVHSHAAAEKASLYNSNVFVVPHVAVAQPTVTKERQRELKETFGLPSDSFVFLTLGSMQKKKRISLVLDSLAEIVNEHPEVHYLAVGPGSEPYEKEAKDLGITDRVVFAGHVDFERFYDAIYACDMCINLRNPWMGEQSGPLLRVMSCGRPAIVSNVGVFAELPDDVCMKITTDENRESQELYDAMSCAVADRKTCEVLGENAMQYISRSHSPEICANGYLDAVKAAIER